MNRARRRLFYDAQHALWERSPAHQPLRPVRLPADEGVHAFPLEWWYLIGQVDTVDAGPPVRFGFELTVARLGNPLTGGSAGWSSVFALLDGGTERYTAVERKVFPPASPVVSSRGGFSFRVRPGLGGGGDWLLRGAGGAFHVRAAAEGRGIDLALQATRPAVKFGQDGVMDYAHREEMAWYSWTRLDTEGTVQVDGVPRRVRGLGWLDHQWGAPRLERYRWKVLPMWLSDGTDLLCYRFSDDAGRPLQQYAARVFADGRHRDDAAEVHIIDVDPPWVAGPGLVYHPRSRVRIPDWGLDLRVEPLVLDQRKDTDALVQSFPVWWEGSCDVHGTVVGAGGEASEISGRAFTEIAGVE